MTESLQPMAPAQNRFDPPLPWYQRLDWSVGVIVVVACALADWRGLNWIATAAVSGGLCLCYQAVVRFVRRHRRRRRSGPA